MRRALVLMSLAAAIVGTGCTTRERQQAASRFAASRSVSAHGLSVSVFVSQQQLGIADRLSVLIEARREGGGAVPWPKALAEAEVGKVFPPNPADMGASDWTIVEVTRRTLIPGHETIELVLEPYLDGNKPIPAFTFSIDKQALTTEPIAVKVISEHKLDPAASATADPLAALSRLGGPLPPAPPRRSWLAEPITWGVAAAGGTLLLGGGAAVIGLRLARRRAATPDQLLELRLNRLRTASATDDEAEAGPIAEQTILALREWLATSGRLLPGMTGRELAMWVRLSGVPAATELADCLVAMEARRFAPAARIEPSQTRSLIGSVFEFAAQLRAGASTPQVNGDRADRC